MPSSKTTLSVDTAEGTQRKIMYSNARCTWLNDYKRELGCMNPACTHTCTYPSRTPSSIILLTLLKATEFELDHVAKATKSFETSVMIERGIGRTKYVLELLKQQVLCKPCHRPKTNAENMLPK